MPRFWKLFLALAVGLAPVAARDAAAQQAGTVQGTVIDAVTGTPLASAQVFLEGTQHATTTNAQGRFLIAGVPAGEYTVKVQLIGYAEGSSTFSLEAGRTQGLTFRLQQEAIQLTELVVTGVSGATQKVKLPFVVDKLNTDKLPVPAMSAGGAIQGKVAGATVVSGTGRPGSAPSILLRGPKSINATGRSQEPLYIVDGVVVGGGIADIPATDIESIEVVKGAAASSLYGSRAAYGVVQITTRRGAPTLDQTRYTLRSEFGSNGLERKISIAQNHRYAMNDAGTKFIDKTSGEEFDWLDGGNDMDARHQPLENGTGAFNTFQDGTWPGQTYDHIDRFFDPGQYLQNYLAVEGRSGGTRYHVSFNNMKQDGILLGQKGLERNSFRINLDQGISDNTQLSASAFYSRGEEGTMGTGGPFFSLTRQPAGIDLMTRDEDGELIIVPDQTGENANPVYELLNRQPTRQRERFMGSAKLRYSPTSWMDLDADISFDRLDQTSESFYKKGFRTARPSSVNGGRVAESADLTEALNGSATMTLRRNFGDEISSRLQFRYSMEQELGESVDGSGTTLAAEDVYTLENTQASLNAGSSSYKIASEGYFAIGSMDIKDRYIIDALVRRDGSSLFGADERWHTYYRAAGAWRVSEEDFFAPMKDKVGELKLRYSLGTAGGRPNFYAQYETYSVSSGGVLRPVSLGNTKLKPELSTEQEFGIEAMLFDRANLSVTYAANRVEDQILNVPLAAYTGFSSQWINGGTLESNTIETSLDLSLMQRENFSWSARLLYDRTRQEITELVVPPYQTGIGSEQGLESVFYIREGEKYGTFYGTRWATSCGDLPTGVNCSEFDVNDDGYLVWVGEGKSWKDGVGPDGELQTGDDLWGTAGPEIRGGQVNWGVPIKAQDADGETFLPLGNTTPDFNFSVGNTVTWKNLTFYGLVDASIGFEVYNLPRQWAYFENYHADQDQAGKPDYAKKPVGYYGSAGLYSQLSPPNSHFVEDGSFVKLREISVRYRFDREMLAGLPLVSGFDGASVSLVGRNLKTWTDYRGYDPEIGFGGGGVGSGAIARFDGFQYPNFRTITAAVELNF